MAGLSVFIEVMRAAGIQLFLLWMLVLAIVWGILHHINLPKSAGSRAVMSIVASFLVLFAAAAGPAVAFISNLLTVGIVIAFGLILVVIAIELVGIKSGEHFFGAHPRFFGGALLVLFILIFIGAGGLGIVPLPSFNISDPILAMLFFLAVMAIALYVLMHTSGGGK